MATATAKNRCNCICGNMLIGTIPMIYGPNQTVYCDGCLKHCCPKEVIYHCMRYNILQHPNGFDLCNKCYINQQTAEVNGSLIDCNKLKPLKSLLKRYYIKKKPIDKHTAVDILNVYLYLLKFSENQDNFENFCNYLCENASCSINQCEAFTNNYRDRKNDETFINKHNMNAYDIARSQIMDKIHCFFCHSFDIGNRLNSKERAMVYTDIKQNDDDDDDDDHNFVSAQLMKIRNILRSKRNKIDNFNIINVKLHAKYNQLQQTKETNALYRKRSMYSFGFRFKYDDESAIFDKSPVRSEEVYHYSYLPECAIKNVSNDGNRFIKVSPKYSCLKEELIINAISRITIEQFNNEYEKALIHYQSNHCKREYIPKREKYSVGVQPVFMKEYVLSLMIYCNYDTLQYHFSKTYRENAGKDHHNFYWLGLYIKMSVQRYGTAINKGRISSFYHGIGQKLFFPVYVGYDKNGEAGVSINCPLSTSSSFEVAVNFTNFNNGLIVEFGDVKTGHSSAKYFPVSWLSDYGNESEYLFIQNSVDIIEQRLTINNIFEIKHGYEFQVILKALQILFYYTSSKKERRSRSSRSMGIEETETLKDMTVKIVEHQLSKSISCHDPFESISKYAVHIIDTFFSNKQKVQIYYTDLKHKDNTFLFDLFANLECEWIKMVEMNTLFPSLQELYVTEVNVSGQTLENILVYLSMHRTKLRKIVINENKRYHHDLIFNKMYDANLQINYMYDELDVILSDTVSKLKNEFEWLDFSIIYQYGEIIIEAIR